MDRPRTLRVASLLAVVLLVAPAASSELEPEARRMLDEGRPAEAVRLIESRSAAPERDADTWVLLADDYRALMEEAAMAGLDVERGLECARHYLDHFVECDDSDRGYGWWRRATLLERTGDVAAAADAYREALRLNPELEGAREGLREVER